MPYSFTTRSNGPGNTIDASHINDLQDAVTEIGPNNESVATGVYSSRPASASVNAGRLYLSSDYGIVSRDTGSAWETWELGRGFTAPNDASFAWVNQGASSVAADGPFVKMTIPTGAGNVRGRTVATPAPPYTVTARIEPQFVGVTTTFIGLILADAADKLHFAGIITGQSGSVWGIEKWNSPTSQNSVYISNQPDTLFNRTPRWLRIVDNNTNRITQVSDDGIYWVTAHTVLRTDFLTPTKVGWAVRNESGSTGDAILKSWEGA